MNISKTQWYNMIFVLIALVALYFLLRYVLVPVINSDEFKVFIEEIGAWGYLIIIFYIVISHVFAPIMGTPGVLLGVSIYGLDIALTLLYIASLISSTINFYISRIYGRKWVIKLAGEKSMNKIDEFVQMEGKTILILARLFGFSFFDVISYAAGLTKMDFKTYFIITAITSAVVNIASRFIFGNLDMATGTGIFIWFISVFATGLIFGTILTIYIKKTKSAKG